MKKFSSFPLLLFASLWPFLLSAQNSFKEQAEAAQQAGHFAEAATLFGQYLTDHPGDASILYQKGFCETSAGEYQQALATLDQALDKGFTPAGMVQFNRAKCLTQLDRQEEALTTLETMAANGSLRNNQGGDHLSSRRSKLIAI